MKPTEQETIMETIYLTFCNGIRNGKASVPRAWLEKKKLGISATSACFNSGQLHHRKPEAFKKALLQAGILSLSPVIANNKKQAYTVFGRYSIMFPLKDIMGHVVNFYSIGIDNEKTGYLNNRGIYPCYPHEATTRLFIVNTVMDAATLLESKTLDNREAVMALHDGQLLPQHEKAIRQLKGLNEIVMLVTEP